MLQASFCDGCSLDAFALSEDSLGPTEVDVGRSEIVDALVIGDRWSLLILRECFLRKRRFEAFPLCERCLASSLTAGP